MFYGLSYSKFDDYLGSDELFLMDSYNTCMLIFSDCLLFREHERPSEVFLIDNRDLRIKS